MKKDKHIVKQNVYIPVDLNSFPEKPDEPILSPKRIRTVTVDEHYPFFDKSLKGRIQNFRIYLGAWILAFPLNRFLYGLKIEGRKNLRANRKHFKNGAITVANHVYRWDYLAVLDAVRFRRMWFPAMASNLETKDADMIRGIGGIPLASNLAGGRKFNETFDWLHSKKKWIHVFPEACRWDFYEPIRPFKKGAFTFAQRWNVPVIPMVFTFRKPTGIYKILGIKRPLVTLHIGTPVFPDSSSNKKECVEKIRAEVHAKMIQMAGIEKNLWECDFNE